MRYLLILAAMFLSACTTPTPVKVTWPEAPAVLLTSCPELKTIDKPEVKLSELMSTVVHNYTEYHKCSDLVKTWQEWYQGQREIFNRIGGDK